MFRTVDAFDVYLGGGVASEVQLGILYQKGVPYNQLPDFLEHIIREFYVHRRDAETFSQYWRRKLQGHKAEPSQQELPTWRCSRCGHLHVAADPPPFCPLCAALRAQFELGPSTPAAAEDAAAASPTPGSERRGRAASHRMVSVSQAEVAGQPDA
jgi:rubredoxin